MHTTVQCPQPVKALKLSTESLCLGDPSMSKYPLLALLPTPSSSASQHFYHHCRPHTQNPSNFPSKDTLQPTLERKRLLEGADSDCDCTPFEKHRRLRSPSPSFTSLMYQWLSQVPRPETAPPLLNTKVFTPVVELIGRPSSTPARVDISPSNRWQLTSLVSYSNKKPSTSDPLYREVIHWNNIDLDPAGLEIEEEIRELLETRILQGRDSPPLAEAELLDFVRTAVDLMDCAEGKASNLIGTEAFPMNRRGIADGRNVQWSTDALPSNPEYSHKLSAPEPDHHYGYPLGRKFDWTLQEMEVVEHLKALPYTQPTRENLFPFLMFEVKSEVTGGMLYVAENQAVGSGVHSVASLRWLLTEAFPSQVPTTTDAVAFTGALSQRLVVLYVVWYSQKKERYTMSKFKNILFTEAPDIQQCRNIIKNILGYGLGIRLPIIRKALAKLNPLPPHWKISRLASAIAEASETGDQTRSKKVGR